jgi:hypothetical protein
MISVAQKTRFFTFCSIFALFFILSSQTKAETFNYKIEAKGVYLGKASIKLQKEIEKKTYSIKVKAKSKGFISKFYNINENLEFNGTIKNDEYVSKSHTVISKTNNYKSNKTAIFNYDKGLIHIINNKTNEKYNNIVFNNAPDLFSYLFSLRENNKLKDNLNFEHDVQFLHKPSILKLNIGKSFVLNSNKVRRITGFTKRFYYKGLNQEMMLELNNSNKKAQIFAQDLRKTTVTTPAFKKAFKVIISDDDKKLPLIIEYKTKFGTFKATLIDYHA